MRDRNRDRSVPPLSPPEGGQGGGSPVPVPVPRQGGFTLLEMIVAAAIFTLVVAGAFALFDGSRRLSARADARAEMLQTARAALRAIEVDLKAAVKLGSAYDSGFIGTDGGAMNDQLEFLAVSSPSSEVSIDGFRDATITRRSDLSKVWYWIEKDTAKTAHGLVRERLGVLFPPESRTRREEDVETLSTEVTGLNLRYYDGQWRESWNSTQSGTMPRAVEVAIQVKREEEVETHTARIYLPVAAETPRAEPR
jgi:type II secretion system protein J